MMLQDSKGSDRPLITFALFAYNQEGFVEEAMAAALAQTYQPLEVIVSDDCSSDNSWQKIQRLARQYTGPHKLIIRRNTSNVGVGEHVNQVFALATGELVVVAAGDDVSDPQRTEQLFKAWVSRGRPCGVVHSSAIVVDKSGVPTGAVKGRNSKLPRDPNVGDFVSSGFAALMNGATAAYTQSLMKCFGPLKCDFEDVPLTFRALLIGKSVYVDEPLVRYRIGVGNLSSHLSREDKARINKWISAQIRRFDQHFADYLKFCSVKGVKSDLAIVRAIKKQRRRYELSMGLGSDSHLRNLFGLVALPLKGGFRDRLYVAAVYYGIKKA